jgi:CHAT domain-containing protein
MIATRRVIQPPSATLLAHLLVEDGLPDAPTIAVVADPVFSSDDPRVATRSVPASAARAEPRIASASLQRLPATGREAAALADLFPTDRRLVATGLAANRALVTSGRLAPYSILHFATHGVFDGEYPLLSGLSLSRIDDAGRAIDGFFGIYDAHDLALSASLVVLSGCETALGRHMRAEGLVGLTHGFLYAGVPRVVASLWRVPERATVELMTAFYGALIDDRLSPSQALAVAQDRLVRSRRWRDPYYWAGFTLQGTW